MLQPSRKTNIMRYNGGELAAIVKMAISMAAADGYFADEEKEVYRCKYCEEKYSQKDKF